ncbi:MAG: AI-2E family transporter [Nitrospirae bacterium]|nr:AI-2E family transporter [Nitrospirota bacterium]
MKASKFYNFTLVVLTLIFGYLSFNVVLPFLNAIGWAIVLGIVFYPMYAFINRFVRLRMVASAITLFILIFIIVGPFSYMLILLGKELGNVKEYIERGELFDVNKIMMSKPYLWIVDKVNLKNNLIEFDFNTFLLDNISKVKGFIVPQITSGLKNIMGVIVDFFIMVFTLYFFFMDGPLFIQKIMGYLPFSDKHKERIANQIKDMVISSIYGVVVVSVTQGVLSGIVFYFLDVHSPVLLGAATLIFSLIPFGAAAVWGTIDIFLFLDGSIVKGVALLLAGTFGISMVDNILRPVFLSGRTNVPVLIVFISVLGGLKMFGLIGLIMGPLVLVLFVSFFEIYRTLDDENGVPQENRLPRENGRLRESELLQENYATGENDPVTCVDEDIPLA